MDITTASQLTKMAALGPSTGALPFEEPPKTPPRKKQRAEFMEPPGAPLRRKNNSFDFFGTTGDLTLAMDIAPMIDAAKNTVIVIDGTPSLGPS